MNTTIHQIIKSVTPAENVLALLNKEANIKAGYLYLKGRLVGANKAELERWGLYWQADIEALIEPAIVPLLVAYRKDWRTNKQARAEMYTELNKGLDEAECWLAVKMLDA